MLNNLPAGTAVDSATVDSQIQRDVILEGDCISILNELPEESVDVIFADPPYNLQLGDNLYRTGKDTKVESCDAEWDKFSSFKDYDDFTSDWLSACQRVLKPDGTIWVIGSFHNIFRVGRILQDLEYWILNDVIWVKENPMPNFLGRRLTNAHETLIWAGKSKDSKYTFNYHALKNFNDDKQLRSDWTFPICSGKERLKSDSGKKVHPTQKPESLIYRVLLASTNAGDLVLDPFFGTGTTGAVAKKMGRHFLGIERESEYTVEARARIEGIEFGSGENLEIQQKKPKEALIPFGNLVEAGLIKPGTVLTDAKGVHQAKVRIDGSLKCGENTGSIHKLGAISQGTDNCNGWKYWHIIQHGERVMIDELRTVYRNGSKNGSEKEFALAPIESEAQASFF